MIVETSQLGVMLSGETEKRLVIEVSGTLLRLEAFFEGRRVQAELAGEKFAKGIHSADDQSGIQIAIARVGILDFKMFAGFREMVTAQALGAKKYWLLECGELCFDLML